MAGERIEAQFTVPASTSVSVANGGQTAAQTLTVTAGSYFLTTLCSQFQSQLNDNIQGYPQSLELLHAALGYGNVRTASASGGWLCNEASGNLIASFGGVNLTAAGTPLYGIAGPKSGIDKAVSVDAAADQFTGADNYDVSGTDDLVVAWIGKFTAVPSGGEFLAVKGDSGASRWGMYVNGAGGALIFELVSTSGTKEPNVSMTSIVGQWHAGLAVIDRGSGNARVAMCTLSGTAVTGASVAMFAGEAHSNADNFTILNRNAAAPATSFQLAGMYVAVGSGIAVSLAANIAAATANLASAVNASWACSFSGTTGKVSLSYTSPPAGVPSFSLDWTSTTLRDLLGFPRNINYPTTAAEMAAMLGYGTWTSGAGYLCNESSGSLAAAFGTPATLAAGSTPLYGLAGPRGGADRAVGFDSANDRFDGGDVFDVDATDDLIVLWVAYNAATPGAIQSLVTKVSSSGAGWQVNLSTNGRFYFQGFDSGSVQLFRADDAGSLYNGEWHVGIATIDRSTGKARMGTRGLTSGTSSVCTEQTVTATSMTNALAFRIGDRVDAYGGAPLGTRLAALYVVTGSGVATGLSANLSSALSNFAATFASTQTGTKQAKSAWFPGVPLQIDSDPKQVPRGDDGSATVSPTGDVYGIFSDLFYRHRNLRFQLAARNKVWSADAALVNEDWETWYLETQRGQHAWFSPFSRVKIYWDNAGTATQLGNGTVASWKIPKPVTLDELRLHVDGYTGLVDVVLGDVFAAVP